MCCVVPCAVSLHPSLVNVHIQHPPEAEIEIHQVARVQPGHRLAIPEGAHSVQQRSQPGNGHEATIELNGRQLHFTGNENGNSHTRLQPRQNGHVGRCFQETVDGQVCCEHSKLSSPALPHHLSDTWKPVVENILWPQVSLCIFNFTSAVSNRKQAHGRDLCYSICSHSGHPTFHKDPNLYKFWARVCFLKEIMFSGTMVKCF